jgi:hypothetical protein
MFPVSVSLINHCNWQELCSLYHFLKFCHSYVVVASSVPQLKNTPNSDDYLKSTDRLNDKVTNLIIKIALSLIIKRCSSNKQRHLILVLRNRVMKMGASLSLPANAVDCL